MPEKSSNQQFVINAIAVLLSTTPEDPLGRLLNLCLASKVENQVQEKSAELFDRPENLAYWIHEVMASDDKHTTEEWLALGDMELTDVESFVEALNQEIKKLPLQ